MLRIVLTWSNPAHIKLVVIEESTFFLSSPVVPCVPTLLTSSNHSHIKTVDFQETDLFLVPEKVFSLNCYFPCLFTFSSLQKHTPVF